MAISSRRLRLAGAGVAVLVIAGTFLTYRLRAPPTRSVVGRYVSNNCGSITISGGTAQYAGQQARFRLIFDKFGLLGELDRPLGPFFVQTLDGSKEPGSLSFDKNTVTAVLSNRQECVFERVS